MCHRKDFSETNYYKSILILSFRYRTLFQKLYWENGGVWSFFGIFSDCLLFVFPSVCPYLNFSHFHLHLHSQWCNFNQTWHTASLPKGNSSLFKWKRNALSHEEIISKTHCRNLKIFFSRTPRQISTKLGKMNLARNKLLAIFFLSLLEGVS